MPRIPPIESVLFDLDGTLLDTAADLTFALNQLVEKYHRQPIATENFAAEIANGTNNILAKALGINQHDNPKKFNSLRNEFLQIYRQHLALHTQFFSGIPILLNFLDQQNFLWGIVTNKPRWLTEPLLRLFKLNQRAKCLVSGDDLPKSKPHPDPLLHACRLTQINPNRCIYVGDTETDVKAANAANIIPVVALYGYLGETSSPASWNATLYIKKPIDLIEILKQGH